MKDEIREKWLHTMEVYDDYERRFAKARANKRLEFPLTEEAKSKVIAETKKILGYREELIPTLHNAETVMETEYEKYTVSQIRYETWDNFFGCATLFMPRCDGKVPLVFLLCGHGDDGRRTRNYVKMAVRLAMLGVAVCIPDNIGQGDREDENKANHNFCHTPFYCGISLQGMIVMETHAVVKYMLENPKIDKDRVGSCGNSGGGTLNVFVAALMPEIKVLCSSGYPSEFGYILSKERRHCCCNLLPGIAHGPEMWEILSIFAPKPMLLEQGINDDLIPVDLAMRNARKVENVYRQMDAVSSFRYAHTKTTHSWADEDVILIGNFLLDNLGIKEYNNDIPDEELIDHRKDWHVDILDRSLTTAEVAENITGIKMPEGTKIQDIFKPKFEGREITPDEIIEDLGRGEVMRVLAQFECTVKE